MIRIACLLIFLGSLAHAPAAFANAPVSDSNPWELSVAYSGTVGVAAGAGSYALTFGGPRVQLSATRFTAALSFYPSLVYSDLYGNTARPTLGFGLEAGWDRVMVFVPTYFVGTEYRTLVGVGYRL